MRAIPYPMLLIFKLEDKKMFYLAHQRISQSDSSKNTLEEFIATDWLNTDNPLLAKLDIKNMRFTNFFTLYSDLLDAISIHNISDILDLKDSITGEEARILSNKMEEIEEQIISLRSRLKKESQFNRKMEMNIEIKRLEQKKNKLLGGDFKC